MSGPPAPSGPLVVVPMWIERAALGGRLPGAIHVGWGPRRWDRANATVRAALDQDIHSGLLILGVCGALTDRLSPGDLVVADELRGPDGMLRCAGAEAITEVLRRTGRTVQVGPIWTADHVIGGGERAALAATGALAVDTESAVLAGAADRLPVLAVRAVSDTPSRPLRSVGIVRSGLSALRALRAAAPVLAAWSPMEKEVG